MTETRAVAEMGGNVDQDRNGNGEEDGIGERGGEVKKRKKPHKRCRHDMGNGGDLDGKRKNVDKKGYFSSF